MAGRRDDTFPGFPDFRANVTFVPIQFFTVVLPYCSRGTARIVGYALRKVLGWVDEHGNPTRERLQFTYRELIEKAGVSRESIAKSLHEAMQRRMLRCLQSPRPDAPGQPAQSGIYELCWDQTGRYTDSPEEFQGFYYPEAAILEVAEGGRVVHRPKAARKNIPNAFFDYLLPREPLSVIRVVGALLFYSIQWGPGGERKVAVSRSITELSRLAKLSRHHVHKAITHARGRGYIEQTDPGRFDPAAGQLSRPATYGIRWITGAATKPAAIETSGDGAGPVGKGARGIQRSELVNGDPDGKGERDRSEMVHREQSQKVNDVRVKTEPKKPTTTDPNLDHIEDTPALVAVADTSFDLLRKAGFDTRTARYLARKRTAEVIERQIAWLSLRHTDRNRLGLLRRAIEQDWAKPEGVPDEPGHCLAAGFRQPLLRRVPRQLQRTSHGTFPEGHHNRVEIRHQTALAPER